MSMHEMVMSEDFERFFLELCDLFSTQLKKCENSGSLDEWRAIIKISRLALYLPVSMFKECPDEVKRKYLKILSKYETKKITEALVKGMGVEDDA